MSTSGAEWAKIEVAHLRNEPYIPPTPREDYAGSVLCLAREAEPDTSAFNAPEIVYRMKKDHHAGLTRHVRQTRKRVWLQLLEEVQPGFRTSVPCLDAAARTANFCLTLYSHCGKLQEREALV